MTRGAQGSGAVTFLSPTGAHERVGWGELYADAARLAGVLQARGAGPGRSVVVLALTSRPAVTAAMATWLAGGALTMAPTPARTTDEATYVAETGRRVDRLGGDPLVLVGSPFERTVPGLAAGGRRRVELLDDVAAAAPAPWTPPALAGHDPAILQLTSGTTASPKTVRISHANLAANLEAIKTATGHRDRHSRMLSWLPLSHDMGLIGSFVLQMSCGDCDTALASPVDYLASPARWLRWVSELHATGTVAPNSAYALAAKLLPVGDQLDLSSLRFALSGGEPVDPAILRAFTAAAAPHGLRPDVLVPAYGMAEAVLAVALTPYGRGLDYDTVDAEALEQEGKAETIVADATEGGGGARRARQLARLGPPVEGMRIRVADPATDELLPERRVGEIQITGTSLSAGYHDDPDATAASRTPDGWLRTGDLGYLTDGELVVAGRAKDLVILAGRNIYPDEVERAAARADGVRPGNAVAFGYERPGPLGSEGLAVAVETRADDHDVVRKSVVDKVQAALGLTPHTVVVLTPGSLPKTPSGKPQRAEARRLFAPTAQPDSSQEESRR